MAATHTVPSADRGHTMERPTPPFFTALMKLIGVFTCEMGGRPRLTPYESWVHGRAELGRMGTLQCGVGGGI